MKLTCIGHIGAGMSACPRSRKKPMISSAKCGTHPVASWFVDARVLSYFLCEIVDPHAEYLVVIRMELSGLCWFFRAHVPSHTLALGWGRHRLLECPGHGVRKARSCDTRSVCRLLAVDLVTVLLNSHGGRAHASGPLTDTCEKYHADLKPEQLKGSCCVRNAVPAGDGKPGCRLEDHCAPQEDSDCHLLDASCQVTRNSRSGVKR